MRDFTDRIFTLGHSENPEADFTALALEAFDFQKENCPVYRQYINLTGRENLHPSTIEEIPFLPIRLFKSKDVQTLHNADILRSEDKEKHTRISEIFTSSATTGMTPSHHIVPDVSIYERSFMEAFRMFYGESGTYNLLALLPSYLERKGSSLVYMADKLIAQARKNGAEGGFFLYDHDRLLDTLTRISLQPSSAKKTILLGVSFALLDFGAFVKVQMPDPEDRRAIFGNVVIMETGGMKGRGKELSRNELHSILSDAFCSSPIHSEYGMCELLSQAYSTDSEGMFLTPPWMRVLARDLQDPFRILKPQSGKTCTGGLNIIDLANLQSCCFIETEDRGTIYPGKENVRPAFTVDGRIFNAELRGCNLLIE